MNCPLPAVTALGLSAVIAGVGLGGTLICKLAAFDVPPPGGGENTVTLAFTGVVMTDAETCAVNWVALTKVVGRALPLIRTTDAFAKPVPLTVNLKSCPPP